MNRMMLFLVICLMSFLSTTQLFAKQCPSATADIHQAVVNSMLQLQYKMTSEKSIEKPKVKIEVKRFKGLKPVKGSKDTFYRFSIFIESFANQNDAKERLQNYRKAPKNLSPSEKKSFPLRQALVRDCHVIIVTTDVSQFEKEQMKPILKEIEEHFSLF